MLHATRRSASLLVSLLTLACTGGPERRSSEPGLEQVLLHNVSIIDGTGRAPQANRSILIEGHRIAAIYRAGSRPAPAGARVLDLTGRFVLPGLIDSHVHLKSRPRPPGMIEEILANVLRSGVTTVRDMGGNGAELAPLARRANSGAIEAPHIVYVTLVTGARSAFWMEGEPGRYIAHGGTAGALPWFRRLAAGGDPGAVAEEAAAHGASALKLHSGLSREEVANLAEEARRRGLRLYAHGWLGPARASDIVAAGAASLSHADMLAYEELEPPLAPALMALPYRERTSRAMAATPIEGEALGRLFALMRRHGTCLEPTLLVMEPSEPDPARAAYVAYAAAAAARAHRTGVAICAGTDAIGGDEASLPDELALLVERAGLTPLQAIRSATLENARALGLADRGLIAPGRRADLLVLGADPSRSIANLRAVAAVFLAGREVPRRR
ncbi:MAG TPA: amidohydrolase family protein [Allosphingosinicella sp.]|jgi:imidazolonepropionase-like amidohydrolase